MNFNGGAGVYDLLGCARGGCGKSYRLNTLLDATRTLENDGCIALATALTGIAALILTLGRTFHSRFKAPLHPTEDDTLNITDPTCFCDVWIYENSEGLYPRKESQKS